MHYPCLSFSLPSFLCLPYPWSNTVPFSRCAQEIMHVGARAHSLVLAFAFALALCRLATVEDPRDTNNDYASTTWSGSCCHMVRLCRSSVDHNNCGSVLKIHTADTSWAAILLPTHSRILLHTFTYANQSLSPLAKGWQAAHADDAIFDCLTFAPTSSRSSLLHHPPLPLHILLLYLWHVFF